MSDDLTAQLRALTAERNRLLGAIEAHKLDVCYGDQTFLIRRCDERLWAALADPEPPCVTCGGSESVRCTDPYCEPEQTYHEHHRHLPRLHREGDDR